MSTAKAVAAVPTRIHFAYRHCDGPWGGANNFIRALRHHLEATGRYTFTESLTDPCDILFLNQLTTGPGGGRQWIPLKMVERLRRQSAPPRIVVRAVNLFGHAFRMGLRNLIAGRYKDRQVIRLLNVADLVVFQSRYQRSFFCEHGYQGSRDVVIHNGADPVYWRREIPAAQVDGVLRIATSTASPRASKRHDLIAKLSELDGVDVVHCGNWPDGLDPRNVRRLGMLPAGQVADVFSRCHVFFHPAVKDPCPNAIFEALCAGLPVIYNAGPGSSAEIVGPAGLALDERDLAGTVARARRELPTLLATVADQRHRYTVERAAREYEGALAECFNQ